MPRKKKSGTTIWVDQDDAPELTEEFFERAEISNGGQVITSKYIDMPQPLGMFAGDLFKRGVEYLDAFEFLTASHEEQFQFASYFLFAHSIELLMKSFLATCEISKKDIISLSHRLPKILECCEKHSIPKIKNLSAYVTHTHEMNRDFDFRYPSGFVLTMPRPAECAPIARALAAAIRPIVIKASLDASLRFTSETRIHKGKKIRWSD
jgi:hypothetical protein